MKGSIITLACFVVGLLAAVFLPLYKFLQHPDLSLYALYVMLFFIGINVGGDTATWRALRTLNRRILLLPFLTIIGSLAGTAIVSLCMSGISMREGMAVGAGLGYYSLSSILIGQVSGQALGVTALVANVLRELLTLLLAPAMKRFAGPLGPISSGAATSMDVTLPIIINVSGKEYLPAAVFSGAVLSLSVPFLVGLIL